MTAHPAADQVPTPPAEPAESWSLPADLVRRLAARVVAAPGAPLDVTHSPLNGAPVGALPVSVPDDVVGAVARAREAQRSWAEHSARDRAAVLLRLHDAVLDRQSEGLDILQLETGKARVHAFDEIADVGIATRYYARKGPGMLRDRHPAGLVPGLTRVTEVRHPKGVVGLITPWNYPMNLVITDAAPALLAGNAVVLKPDSQTTFTALWLAQLLADAGLPEGLFAVVHGEGPVLGPSLIQSVDYVCFTGSTATGRRIATQAADRLIGVSLELGGKNPVYVSDDVDLDRAAEAIVRDCFSNSGHACVSMERLILHERIADAFLDRFVDRVRRLKLGAALDYTADFGSIASAAQFDTVRAHVADAVAKGATVLTGGRPRPDIGPYFYEPTVLDDVPPSAMCYGQETFGPVVSVYRVGSDAEAIRLANDTPFGLNGSVWCRDRRRGVRLARRIDVGTVVVNEAYAVGWGSIAAPMGGRKDSGLGRRHAAEGLLRYTEPQSIAVQRIGLAPLFSRGGEFYSSTFTRALKVTRAIRYPWP